MSVYTDAVEALDAAKRGSPQAYDISFVPFAREVVRLTEIEVLTRRWVACSIAQMRQERGKGFCPHSMVNGGEQEQSCFKYVLDALTSPADATDFLDAA